MFDFGKLEETGKAVVTFVNTASAQIAQLLQMQVETLAELKALRAEVAGLNASHETIMGYIAESDNDAAASIAVETAAAATAVAEAAAQVTEAAAVVAEAAETPEAAPAEAVADPVVEVVEPAAAVLPAQESPPAAEPPTAHKKTWLDRL